MWIDHLAWHPQRPWLAVAIARQVLIWDAVQQAPVITLNFAESSVLDLAWHPDGSMLAIGGSGRVRIWACADWQDQGAESLPIQEIQLPGPSLSIAWSPDGRYLASGNLDRTLTLWEWGHSPPWLMQGFPGKVRQVQWSPPIASDFCPEPAANDWACVAVCFDGVALWSRLGSQSDEWRCQVMNDRHQGRPQRDRRHPNRPSSNRPHSHRPSPTVRTLAMQPGTTLVVSGDLGGGTYLWDLECHHDPVAVRGKGAAAEPGVTGAIAWHPEQPWFVTGSDRGAVHLWRFQVEPVPGARPQTHRGFGGSVR
jgi:WD40 repeat protein